jgi:hypothetical protein
MIPIAANTTQRFDISSSAFYRRWSGVYHRRTNEPQQPGSDQFAAQRG